MTNMHWEAQPRVPAGNPDGGQWTSDGISRAEAAAREAAGINESRAEEYPVYEREPVLASEISGKVPVDREGKPVPVKTKKQYHVTKWENVQPILEEGFDLKYVRPRWRNDYAVSLSKGLKPALDFFTGSGQYFNLDKYALLEVTVKGRFANEYDVRRDINFAGSSAQEYTRNFISSGYDAYDMSGGLYVYNPRAITRIRVVPEEDVKKRGRKP